MTVASLVNAWGFGFEKRNDLDTAIIDSLKQFIGYEKVQLVNNKILKEFPGTMLDASAIAKGFAVDVIANYLEMILYSIIN